MTTAQTPAPAGPSTSDASTSDASTSDALTSATSPAESSPAESSPAESMTVHPIASRSVRAVRGAIQIESDDRDAILAGTASLVVEVMARNQLSADDIISVVFTATPDLTAEFPAYAARQLGLTDVPLLCATEISVPGAMPRVLRLLAHVETALARADVRHVYLGGAATLRTDLPQ